MSVNLLGMAQNAIGGPIMDQLGGILGEDRSKTESAIGASLPAILGGLLQTASSNDGMREINRMADEADGGILDNLGSMLSNNSGALLSIGGPLLAMLFGSKQDGLIGTIAKMAGIGGGSSGSLLKMLIPVVVSLLGRQKTEQNMDEGQLRTFLMDQKQDVANAMPAEVSDAIGFGDFLNEGSRTAESAQPASHSQPVHTADTGGGGGMMKMLLPLIVIAGLGYLAYSYFGGSKPDMPNIEMSDPAAIKTQVTESLGGVATSISGITNEETAQAAVEKINSANETIGGLPLDKLPGAAGFLGPLVEKIQAALETAYKIPGVEGIIKPAIEPLLAKLSGI